MEVVDLSLAGLKLVKPRVFSDARGFFLEIYQGHKYREAGLPQQFVQDNHSLSVRGVLRGLHYQLPNPQGKLVVCLSGEILDVAVDLRRASPTFGRWYGVQLSGANHWQLYVPDGFAHGFCVLSDMAHVLYKCTDYYSPGNEHTLIWNDPMVGIDWPVREPVLSEKDAHGKRLSDCPVFT